MKFEDIIKYIDNYDFILRIYKENEIYEIQTNCILELLNLYSDLSLKSIKVLKNKLIISLVDM